MLAFDVVRRPCSDSNILMMLRRLINCRKIIIIIIVVVVVVVVVVINVYCVYFNVSIRRPTPSRATQNITKLILLTGSVRA